jgi:hypothetical protein
MLQRVRCCPVLGLPPSDLLCTWRCDDRRALIEHTYLAERARLGAPVPGDLYWELDAALLVASSATRLRRLAGLQRADLAGITAGIREICTALAQAAQQVGELEPIRRMIDRRVLR